MQHQHLLLLQQQTSSAIQHLLGQAEPLLQLVLLRLERLGLRLQQLQQRQERREQQQQQLLLLQWQLQQPPLPPFSPAGLGLHRLHKQLQQQHPWQQHLQLRGRGSDSNTSTDGPWGQDGPAGGPLRHFDSYQQQQSQHVVPPVNDAGLLVLPHQGTLPSRSEAPLALAARPAPHSASSPYYRSAVVAPAAAFARAAAAAEGLLDLHSAADARRCCSCCCSSSMPGGLLPQQQIASRHKSSLLSSASVGRDPPGLQRPRTAAAVAAPAASTSGSGLPLPPAARSFPPEGQVRALGRLSAPAQLAAATFTGTSLVATPNATGSAEEEDASADSRGKFPRRSPAGAASVALPAPTAVATAHRQQWQQEETPVLQTCGANEAYLAEPVQPLTASSLSAATTQQQHPVLSAVALDLRAPAGDHRPPPSFATGLTPPPQEQIHHWEAPEGRKQQQEHLTQVPLQQVQDWLGGAETTQRDSTARREGEESSLRLGEHSTQALLDEHAATNVSYAEESAQQQDTSTTQQHLMQSYSGSVSSIDLQHLTALRVPLRQLLNDQESLLETLDADYREAPVAAATGGIRRFSHLKREEKCVSTGDGIQVEGRGTHREVEVRVSVPMSFLNGKGTGAAGLAERPAALDGG